jgi:hypothetical protein
VLVSTTVMSSSTPVDAASEARAFSSKPIRPGEGISTLTVADAGSFGLMLSGLERPRTGAQD